MATVLGQPYTTGRRLKFTNTLKYASFGGRDIAQGAVGWLRWRNPPADRNRWNLAKE